MNPSDHAFDQAQVLGLFRSCAFPLHTGAVYSINFLGLENLVAIDKVPKQ